MLVDVDCRSGQASCQFVGAKDWQAVYRELIAYCCNRHADSKEALSKRKLSGELQ